MAQAHQRVAVIINPISGTGGRPEIARRRAELAAALVEARGGDADIFMTERPGHARDLARAALNRGVTLLIAWGGDGTVNEIGSVVAFQDAALAIVRSGSGNGLARELGIPAEPERAFAIAFEGRDLLMDAGELDGHLFFNVAGLGLDARVAHRFAAEGLLRRGFARYMEIAARELFTYSPDEHTVVTDGNVLRERALLVAIANARQYGNGALIAPCARIDDGLLDVVVVAQRSVIATLVQVPRLFLGQIEQVSGITIRQAEHVEITSARPVIYHVDGEPFVGGASITARALPRALRVRVPKALTA